MIDEKHARRLCLEALSLIENYDKAVADKNETWDIHHRRETDEGLSGRELLRRKEYFHRPACELIFLKHGEHSRLHNLGNKYMLGQRRSEATRKKIAAAHVGRHWYNNGVKNVCAKSCPPGFVKGRKFFH